MHLKNGTLLLVAVLSIPLLSYAQASSLIQQASNQFRTAERAEAALYDKAVADRTRAEYLKVIRAYERVYLITPKTGWADNALTSIARLYEEINDPKNAVKTLEFLVREYPQTPLKDVAEADIRRLSGAPESSVNGSPSVENIRFWQDDVSVRVVVDVSGEFTIKSGEAKSPERFYVDINPVRLNSLLVGKEWPVKSKDLQKIRVAQYDASTVRVVLDGVTAKSVVASMLKDPSRIILDVATGIFPTPAPAAPITSSNEVKPPATNITATPPSVAASVTATPASSTSTVSSPTPKKEAAPPPPPPSAVPPTAQPSPTPEPARVVTEAKPTNSGGRSLIRSLGLKLSRVVLDAGHGGHDTGSMGPSGYMEKELVLDVAQRLKTMIETEMGAEVVMTRDKDEFVPLESRTLIANKESADLFISIHANSSQTKSVRGVETFFLNFNTQSRDALTTASRENAASELAIHELQDLVKKIMLNDKVDESRELAQHIQDAMSKRQNAGNNRGVKQAPFVVLIGANMPSILAEVSFISNPDEEKRLKTTEYRQQIAESLLQGIKSYAETLSSTKTAGATADKTR